MRVVSIENQPHPADEAIDIAGGTIRDRLSSSKAYRVVQTAGALALATINVVPLYAAAISEKVLRPR